MIADHYLSIGNVKEARTWIQSIYQWIEPEMHDDMKAHSSDLNSWFNQQMEKSVNHEEAVKFIRKLCPEIEKLRKEPLFNKEQMKLGVLFARNHLISAYRANFIDCDLKKFAQFMNLLSLVARESIDIELMMEDVLACNDQAEEWIKQTLESTVSDNVIEVEKPQTYAVGWNGKLVKSDTGEIVNLYDVMEILNKHGVKIKDE
ncbi:hypothetical protein QU814_17080 [Providencia rettgeri]|nr:hypothetical protein [Providencia rettgeri]MDM9284847.1 hypothetical protein [Providencia rettgeri]